MSEESRILKPESTKDAEKATERARQLVRRHIALEVLPMFFASSTDTREGDVDAALIYADLLIAKTGGHE